MCAQEAKVLHASLEQDPAEKAWSIILHHPAVSSSPRNICTLLQVSNTTRAMLLRSENHLADLQLTELPRTCRWRHHPLHSAELLANFSAWIPKHAGLVRSIEVSRRIFSAWHADPDDTNASDSVDDGDGLDAAERTLAVLQQQAELDSAIAIPILQNSLQLAALQPSASSFSTTATPAARVLAAPAAFQLQCFSSDFSPSAAVLSALPAASLTKLALDPDDQLATTPHFTAALTKLKNLQELQLGHGLYVHNIYSAVVQFSKLTNLGLDVPCWDVAQLALLPTQLQQLHLAFSYPANTLDSNGMGYSDTVKLNLSHLSILQRLSLVNFSSNQFAPGSTLPSAVQDLNLGYYRPIVALGVPSLQHLRRLQLSCTHKAQELLFLKSTSQLEHLSLSYHGQFLPSDLGIAAVWQQLPLRDLWVTGLRMTAEQAVTLLKGIGAATTLTSLFYDVTVPYRIEDPPNADNADHPLKAGSNGSKDWFDWLISPHVTRIPTCELLRDLTNLRSLKFRFNGNGYLRPSYLVEQTLWQNGPPHEASPWSSNSSRSLLGDDVGLKMEAMHLTALQQLTHLDFRGVDVPGVFLPFVNEDVVNHLSGALHQLKELHLAPGHVRMRFKLSDCVRGLARMTGLQELSIEGAEEQDPDSDCDSRELEYGYDDHSLGNCLWKLTQLTGLTYLGGFETCGRQELQKYWDTIRGGGGTV